MTSTDPPPANPGRKRESTFAALRDENFARYCAAYIPSMSGTWIRITAMGYLVYDLTGDSARLGLISLATSLPQIFLGPVSASFIDRVNRRNVLVVAQVLTVSIMALTAWLIATDQITFTRLMVIAVILGSLLTFDVPVRIALISALVDRSLLQNAIAINSSMFNIARIIGPSLAGWFISIVGIAWAFGATALIMLPFPIVLMTIPRLRNVERPTQSDSGPLEQLRDGVRYIRQTPQIAALILMSFLPNVIGMNYVTLAPAYVSDVLHRDAGTLGYVLAANGFGAFIGTFSVAHFNQIRGRGPIITVTLIALGVSMVLFGLANSVWLAFLAVFLLGLSWGFTAALTDTGLQLHVAESHRGRVMSVYTMIVGIGPGSALLFGLLANAIGIDLSIAFSGVLILALIPLLWYRTALREVD